MRLGHRVLVLLCALSGGGGCPATSMGVDAVNLPASPDVLVSVASTPTGAQVCVHKRNTPDCAARLLVDRSREQNIAFVAAGERTETTWAVADTAPAAAIALLAVTALGIVDAECADADCGTSARAPQDPALDFDAFGGDAARAYFITTAPASRSDALRECGDFQRWDGDHVCTGWVNYSARLDGLHDLSHCCEGHDRCFYECPLDEDGETCSGTECIRNCNRALEGCCYDAGGGPINCQTMAVATDLGGGRGRNGCGKSKALEFCAEADFENCGDTDRCVCESCNDIAGTSTDCSACTCQDECDPEFDAPYCYVDGRGHHQLVCQRVDYDRCYKWSDTPCGPDEQCIVDANDSGETVLRCEEQVCPHAPECEDGVAIAGCFADDGGAYRLECAVDPYSCRYQKRVYCVRDDGSSGACVVDPAGNARCVTD